MDVNDRVTAVRKSLGLTQQEFGERIGFSRGVIANIDLKRNLPAQSVLTAISREFNVSYPWLMDGIGEMIQHADEDTDVSRLMLTGSDFAKSVFRTLAKMPPELWAVFQSFVDQLKSEQQKSDQD